MLKWYHLLIIVLLISFASVMGLLFTPALPSLAKDLAIPETMAQWTISIFLVGYCLGILPYGPLANRFGRKKTIFIGIGLALISSVCAYLSTSFWILLTARFFQALGSSVGLKVSFTMISDQHEGARAAKLIALLSLAFGIMPGIAVAIGGFLTHLAGWRGCFLFLIFYAAFIGLLALLLPETAKKLDHEALKVKKIVRGYGQQLKNRSLILHAFLVTLATSMIYVFAALGPFIGIELIGMTPPQYGVWNLLPAAGTVCGGLLSRVISGRFDPRSNILLGIVIIALSTITMGASFALGFFTVWSLFLIQYVIQLGTNFIWTSGTAVALSSSSDKSNASATLQFINMGGACASSFLITIFPPTTPLLLPGAFGVAFLLMLLLWSISRSLRSA